MCYYDSWFEENWCEEPREEETALIEAIKESVRQDIKSEMERLRKENAELQQYKQERQEVENIKKWYESRLQTEVEAYKRELRSAKIKELFGDYIVIGWGVKKKITLPPKCDKCDEVRYIHFKSPSGKDLREPCQCAKGKKEYLPLDLHLIRIHQEDIFNGQRKIFGYYAPCAHNSDDYRDVFDRVYKGEPFEKINEWNVVFLDKETCEKYCEWKTEQEAKKDGKSI